MSEATCGSTFLPRAIVVYTKDMLGFDNESEGVEVEAIAFLVWWAYQRTLTLATRTASRRRQDDQGHAPP